MMRTIRAEEALQQTSVTAVGSGTLKKIDSTKRIRNWARDAARHPTQIFKGPRPSGGSMPDLAGIGIGYVKVPKKVKGK